VVVVVGGNPWKNLTLKIFAVLKDMLQYGYEILKKKVN